MRIAQLLASLTKLRRLKILLEWKEDDMETAPRVRDAAQVFARELGTCLRVMFVYSEGNVWRMFTVLWSSGSWKSGTS